MPGIVGLPPAWSGGEIDTICEPAREGTRSRASIREGEQCLALIASLPESFSIMVLVAVCAALRVSEILALGWTRLDFDRLTITIKVKAVNGRLGRVKTECAEDELEGVAGKRRVTGSFRVTLPTGAFMPDRSSRITVVPPQRN